jgi:putative hydrolase of the HAD superfamily
VSVTTTEAVIFDFGNVLCFPPDDAKVEQAAHYCGMTAFAFLEKFWSKRLAYDGGLMEPLEYWITVVGEEFAVQHLDQLIRIEVDFWNTYDERPFAWIAQLRSAGIRVGMLSNLPRVLGEALRKEQFLGRPFYDHFDHLTLSYELKSVKPQHPIYHHAFEGLHVDPARALFIDDKLPNVHGATETGLHAELYTTWEDFLSRAIPATYGLLAPK